jgi:hypothetical protein
LKRVRVLSSAIFFRIKFSEGVFDLAIRMYKPPLWILGRIKAL